MRAKLEKLLDELHGDAAEWHDDARISQMNGDTALSARCFVRAQTIEGFIERLQELVDSEETPG